jgi:ubiquinol-cytochrome c reductase cytochrome b subunit
VVALRTLLVLGPLVAFQLTRQLCLALVAKEREQLTLGFETGRIVRGPAGGYREIHAPLDAEHRAVIEQEPAHVDRVA